jgi:hypothetical protein
MVTPSYVDNSGASPPPPASWEIVFTDDFYVDLSFRRTELDKERLAKEIKRAGLFYLCARGGLCCVVNNYKAYDIDVNAEEKKLNVLLLYPYTQSLGQRLNNYRRVNIPCIGKSCESGRSLEKLIKEGARLQHKGH